MPRLEGLVNRKFVGMIAAAHENTSCSTKTLIVDLAPRAPLPKATDPAVLAIVAGNRRRQSSLGDERARWYARADEQSPRGHLAGSTPGARVSPRHYRCRPLFPRREHATRRARPSR